MSPVTPFRLDSVAGFNIRRLISPTIAAVAIILILATIAYIATRIRDARRSDVKSARELSLAQKESKSDVIDSAADQAGLQHRASDRTPPEKEGNTDHFRNGGQNGESYSQAQPSSALVEKERESSVGASHVERSLRAKIAGQARELEVLRRGLRRMESEARKKGIEILVERIQYADSLGKLRTQVKLLEADIDRVHEKEGWTEVAKTDNTKEDEAEPPQYRQTMEG